MFFFGNCRCSCGSCNKCCTYSGLWCGRCGNRNAGCGNSGTYMAVFSLKDVAGTMLKSVKYWLILIALTASTAASLWVKLLKFNDILAILVSAVLFFGIYLLVMIIFKEPLVHETFIQIKNKFKKENHKNEIRLFNSWGRTFRCCFCL